MAYISSLLNAIKTAVYGRDMRRALHDAIKAVNDDAVTKTQYATETTPGIVTLRRGGSGNNSGLLVDASTGALTVNVSPDGRFGLTRDGAGQIKTYAATEEEIKARENQYKPVVPAMIETAVESVTGAAADIKITDSNGISYPIPSPGGLVHALNRLGSETEKARKAGVIGFIDSKDTTWLAGGTVTTKTSKPDGVYFWIPDKESRSINGLSYISESNEALFKAGYLYMIELGSNKSVLYSQYDEEQKRFRAYSTTPTRTGTWIDGTPIWRIAIPITPVENIGCTDPKAVWITTAISILAKLDVIANPSKVVYADGSLIFQNAPDYDSDAFSTNSTEYSPGRYRFTASSIDYTTHFYGWVEFVTAASNIKTTV